MTKSIINDLISGTIKVLRVKYRKHFSKPLQTHKSKKGKGSYKRLKKFDYEN